MTDGTRHRGYVYNFSPGAESLHLFPSDSTDKRFAKLVELRDCKAIFFVRTHEGNRAAREASRRAGPKRIPRGVRGVKMRIHFKDGEVLMASSEAYSPSRPGFFAYPLEADSNNLRIFVVNANVRQVVTGTAAEDSAPTGLLRQGRTGRSAGVRAHGLRRAALAG